MKIQRMGIARLVILALALSSASWNSMAQGGAGSDAEIVCTAKDSFFTYKDTFHFISDTEVTNRSTISDSRGEYPICSSVGSLQVVRNGSLDVLSGKITCVGSAEEHDVTIELDRVAHTMKMGTAGRDYTCEP